MNMHQQIAMLRSHKMRFTGKPSEAVSEIYAPTSATWEKQQEHRGPGSRPCCEPPPGVAVCDCLRV